MPKDVPQSIELAGMIIEGDDRRCAKGGRPESSGIGEQQEEGEKNITAHDDGSYRNDTRGTAV
jgi:hypothetical protein